jgi:hypothetical protein
MPALVAGIHVFLANLSARKTGMAGTSPATTPEKWGIHRNVFNNRNTLYLEPVRFDVLRRIPGRHAAASA